MEILVGLEVLPDQRGADDGAILFDEAAVRLARERDLRRSRQSGRCGGRRRSLAHEHRAPGETARLHGQARLAHAGE